MGSKSPIFEGNKLLCIISNKVCDDCSKFCQNSSRIALCPSSNVKETTMRCSNNPNFLQQFCNSIISILSSVLSCVKQVKPSTKPYLRTLKRLGKKVTKSNTMKSNLGSWTCCTYVVVQKKDFVVLVLFNSITD